MSLCCLCRVVSLSERRDSPTSLKMATFASNYCTFAGAVFTGSVQRVIFSTVSLCTAALPLALHKKLCVSHSEVVYTHCAPEARKTHHNAQVYNMRASLAAVQTLT